MAVASIKLVCKTCGNAFVWKKTCYNRAEANNSEEWARNNVEQCSECWKKEQAEKKKVREIESAKKYEEELGKHDLPELEGTEKQVAWANTIRSNAVGKLLKYEPNGSFWDWIRTKTTAKWWIEKREDVKDIYTFTEIAAKEMEEK